MIYCVSDKNGDEYTFNTNTGLCYVDPYDANRYSCYVTRKDVPVYVLKKLPKVVRLLFFDL